MASLFSNLIPGNVSKNSRYLLVISGRVFGDFRRRVTHPERSYASLGCCDSAPRVLPGLDAARSNELHRPPVSITTSPKMVERFGDFPRIHRLSLGDFFNGIFTNL